jgi:NAD-dependent deacetylase
MAKGRLIIFTGAGISAASGIATFRGTDGLWENHKIEDVCDAWSWFKNRDLVHAFYNARRVQLGTVAPNAAHLMVARLQDRYGATVLTQNVDDLHERAAESELVTRGKILHVHGRLTEMTCTQCRTPWDIGYRDWDTAYERCPGCGTRKLVRPNIVFFREEPPAYPEMYDTLEGLTEQDVLVVIGTSSAVIPIGRIAHESRALTLLSNLTAEPELVRTNGEPNFDVALYGPTEEKAEAIEQQIARWLA